jgi:plasmid maintenance system antidote protein VapI
MSRLHNPAHPGEVLREYLPEALGGTESAKRLGVIRQALSAVLNGLPA